MTTAEALEAIADSGRFEILASQALRIIDADCTAIEHLGINAAGKTIAGSIDGFGPVPGSDPPTFVIAAFTTAATKKLHQKWLANPTPGFSDADTGDFLKAVHKAEAIRATIPHARFVIYLCTNRVVEPALQTAVRAAAVRHEVEVRFLGQTRLRDALDTRGDGQYLRHKHLGIRAERLSAFLLQELGCKSLAEYAKDFLITPPSSFVCTESSKGVSAALGETGVRLVMAVGRSGAGKSVAAFQALAQHLSRDGFGLHIPETVAEHASSIEDAILQTLRIHEPGLDANSGIDALRLATHSKPLLLVVDDVRRTANPAHVVQRWARWTTPERSSDQEELAAAHYRILMPAWESFWASLRERLGRASWVRTFSLERFDVNDAVACLHACMGDHSRCLTEPQCREIVAEIECDPILIALFAHLSAADSSLRAPMTASKVVESFVAEAISHDSDRATHLTTDLLSGLRAVTLAMLRNRDLTPAWDSVKNWLSPIDLDAVRLLVRSERLCRVVARGQVTRFEFRHDRILEHFATAVIHGLFADPTANTDILLDPFYAEYVGRALAAGCTPQAVSTLARHQPIALAAAIGLLDESKEEQTSPIIGPLRDWLVGAADHNPPVEVSTAIRLLEIADSPLVLRVLDQLRDRDISLLARAVNGDSLAAIRFIANAGGLPAMEYPWLEARIELANRQYGPELRASVRRVLETQSEDDLLVIGALTLAGYLADSTLAPSIAIAFDRLPRNADTVFAACWAGLRCFDPAHSSCLARPIRAWVDLGREQDPEDINTGPAVSMSLQRTMRWTLGDAAMQWLADNGRKDPDLNPSVTWLLQEIDHPIAVRFTIEEIVQAQIRWQGRSPTWVDNYLRRWDPLSPVRSQRISAPSLATARAMWNDSTSDQALRSVAFRVWVRWTDDLEQLRSSESVNLEPDSLLRRRTLLGDKTCGAMLAGRVHQSPLWWRFAAEVWCPHLLEQARLSLARLATSTPRDWSGGQTNEHVELAKLLRDIPLADAESLLDAHWSGLRTSPCFIHAALYLGSPSLLACAHDAIGLCPEPTKVFEHVDHFFGFMEVRRREALSERHVRALLLYCAFLSDHALVSIAQYGSRTRQPEMLSSELRAEIAKRRASRPTRAPAERDYLDRLARALVPSDDDLLEDLDQLENDRQPWIIARRCLDDFDPWCNPPGRWQRLAGMWFDTKPTLARLRVVASIVAEAGTRPDLALLTRHSSVARDPDAHQIIQDATFRVRRRSLR